jgi:hypothetical protein
MLPITAVNVRSWSWPWPAVVAATPKAGEYVPS